MAKNIFKMIPQGVGFAKAHWNKPLKPDWSLSLKEMVSYCFGGIGVMGANNIPTFFILAYGVYVGAALGIKNEHILWIGIITSVVTILRSPFISWVIDNFNSKRFGKFRFWLIFMPLPSLICILALGWIPTLISSYVAMLVVYTIIFNILQVFMALYGFGFTTLIQVISPNPEERTLLMSAGAICYSLGPSIVSAAFPFLANLLFASVVDGVKKGDGVNKMGAFQYIMPIMALIFFAVGYIAAFGAKERTVVAKNHVQRIPFLQGVKKAFKNKLFLIINFSNIFAALRIILMSFTAWICMYMLDNSWAQGVFVTILGMAYVPGMALAPILIKKFGKRNLVLVSTVVVASFSALAAILLSIWAIPQVVLAYIMIAIIFITTLSNSVQVVTAPAMLGQLYDYQQYKTGDRLEGFLSQFGTIIVTAFGIGIAFITPAVYAHFGFLGDDKTILYNRSVINPIISTMCWIGAGFGIAAAIPYLFWDITEKKHKIIMEVLKLRAAKEDGLCDAEELAQLELAAEGGQVGVFVERFPQENMYIMKSDSIESPVESNDASDNDTNG